MVSTTNSTSCDSTSNRTRIAVTAIGDTDRFLKTMNISEAFQTLLSAAAAYTPCPQKVSQCYNFKSC